jgi:hypothetical protein
MVLNYSAKPRTQLFRIAGLSCLALILVAAAYAYLAPLDSPLDLWLDRIRPHVAYIVAAGCAIVAVPSILILRTRRAV